MRERLPSRIADLKPVLKAMGKCTECVDTMAKSCNNNGNGDRIVYNLSVERNEVRYNPHLEKGTVEECIIYQGTIK